MAWVRVKIKEVVPGSTRASELGKRVVFASFFFPSEFRESSVSRSLQVWEYAVEVWTNESHWWRSETRLRIPLTCSPERAQAESESESGKRSRIT